jgi:hypothetical protein
MAAAENPNTSHRDGHVSAHTLEQRRLHQRQETNVWGYLGSSSYISNIEEDHENQTWVYWGRESRLSTLKDSGTKMIRTGNKAVDKVFGMHEIGGICQ